MKYRNEKMVALLEKLASQFILDEAGPNSLITVTNASYNEKSNRAIIFISVLPTDQEQNAIDFVSRKVRDFREFITEHAEMRAVPLIEFRIDPGEKNRQILENLQ